MIMTGAAGARRSPARTARKGLRATFNNDNRPASRRDKTPGAASCQSLRASYGGCCVTACSYSRSAMARAALAQLSGAIGEGR